MCFFHLSYKIYRPYWLSEVLTIFSISYFPIVFILILKNVHITGCFEICVHYEILHGTISQMHGSTSYCFLCVMATLSLFVTWRVCYLLPLSLYCTILGIYLLSSINPTFPCPTTVRTHSSLLWDLLRSHVISCGVYLVQPGLFHVTLTLLVHPCYRKWLCFLFYKAVSYSTVYVDSIASVHSSVDPCWGWVRMSAIGLQCQETGVCSLL